MKRFLVILALCTSVAAQTEPAAEPEAAAPAPKKLYGGITFYPSIANGTTNTKGYSLTGMLVWTPTSARVVRFDVADIYSQSDTRGTPPGSPNVVVKSDTRQANLTFTNLIAPRWSFVSLANYTELTEVPFDRAIVEVGIGYHAIQNKRAQVMIAPGVAYGHQDSPLGSRPVRAVGAFESVALQVTKTISVMQWATYLYDFNAVGDHRNLTANAALNMQLTKFLGVSVTHSLTFNGELPRPRTQANLGAGVSLNF